MRLLHKYSNPLLSLYIVLILMLGVNASSSLGLLYFVFWFENPPIEFIDEPFPTEYSVYSQGDPVRVTGRICRHTLATYTRYPVLRRNGGEDIQLPQVTRSGRDLGCDDIITTIGIIPLDYPPGPGVYFENKLIYHVPLGLRVAIYRSQYFTVTERIQ